MVLFVEATHSYHPEKGFQPAHLYVLAGMLIMALGIFHAKLEQLARMTCSSEKLFVRTSLFRAFEISWNEIASTQVSEQAILLLLKSGNRRKIGLRKIENKSEVVNFFSGHWDRQTDQAALDKALM